MSALENLLLQKYHESIAELTSHSESSSEQASAGLTKDEQAEIANAGGSAKSSSDVQEASESLECPREVITPADSATDDSNTEAAIADDTTAQPSSSEYVEISSELTKGIHWSVEIAAGVAYDLEPMSPLVSADDDAHVEDAVVEESRVDQAEYSEQVSPEIAEPSDEVTETPIPATPATAPESVADHALTRQSVPESPTIVNVAGESEQPQDVPNPVGDVAGIQATEAAEVTATAPIREIEIEARDQHQEPSDAIAREPEATVEEPEPVEAKAETSGFKAEWEVDSFLWPDFCGELEAKISSDLVTAVEHIRAEFESQSIDAVMVTAAQNGSGRTTLTLCLAREALRQGKSVAIVDLDHQQPALMSHLGVEVKEGIESLDENVSGESICVKAVEDGVTLLPLVSRVDSAKCVDDRVQQLLALVAANHDIVLIDASADVAELLSHSQKLRLGSVIVDDKRVAANLFRNEIIDRVRGGNCRCVGIIENFAA